jgi:hypothetical protein
MVFVASVSHDRCMARANRRYAEELDRAPEIATGLPLTPIR